MAKKVTIIKPVSSKQHTGQIKKLRVCAYVRVSTGSKAQIDSYAAQTAYFAKLIENNPLWEFAGIFADEAATGTKVKKRDNFQRMLEECEDGNIDLILTKSVTRFARNTVDSIQTIRKLKAHHVGIFFEKENVNTLTEKSELLITVLSSLAQSESEDFSGNSKWGIMKRFKDGTYVIATPAYGYENDEDGNLIINEEEAKIVRFIFKSYLNGKGTYVIAKELNDLEIPTIRKSQKWKDCVVRGILLNPVYEGDVLYQKTYKTTIFPTEHKWNYGEMPQYFIKDDHPAIVAREEAKTVREIFEYRKTVLNFQEPKKYNNRYLFTSRIICGECGSTFRRQKLDIGKASERVAWICNKHIEDKESCSMTAIREDDIHQAFIHMWNKLYTNQGAILEPFLEGIKKIPISMEQQKQIEALNNRITELNEQSRILNQVMKKGYMDSAIFTEKQNLLTYDLYEIRKEKSNLLNKNKRNREIAKTEQLTGLLKSKDRLLDQFDEQLFDLMVEHIRIEKNHAITFVLHNHMEFTEEG